jgi:hypothetical protein
MLEQRAPESVESAFEFARGELERDFPEYVPWMSDGVPGDLILGPIRVARSVDEPRPPGSPEYNAPPTYGTDGQSAAEQSPPPPPRRRTADWEVCGPLRYNCD